MPDKPLCSYCTLPATRHSTVNGRHYPRLCLKHFRQVYETPEKMPPLMEHADDINTSPVRPDDGSGA